MRDREWRRAQHERKAARVKSWMERNGWFSHDTDEEKLVRIQRTAKTPAPCSCWACGNPRKWFKAVTIQERSWDEQSRDVFREEGVEQFVPCRRKGW